MQKPHGDWPPRKIISGGQTGVDRAALDVAIELHIQHGGWCPKGRLAEDGRIPDHYKLAECASPHYDDRTRENVGDADATLVLCFGPPSGGTKLTIEEARRQGKPCLVVQLSELPQSDEVRRWAIDHHVRVVHRRPTRKSMPRHS